MVDFMVIFPTFGWKFSQIFYEIPTSVRVINRLWNT